MHFMFCEKNQYNIHNDILKSRWFWASNMMFSLRMVYITQLNM